jgi:hypothetical protein
VKMKILIFSFFKQRTTPRHAVALQQNKKWKSWIIVHTDRLSMWSRENAKSRMSDGVICIRSCWIQSKNQQKMKMCDEISLIRMCDEISLIKGDEISLISLELHEPFVLFF